MSAVPDRGPSPGPVPLESVAQWRGPGSVLPAPLTRLIGRERELSRLVTLIRSERHRLLTLTGPGGVGKTRLAIGLAEQVERDFPDGVWFVSLATLTDPALVLQTVAHALGVRDAGGRPPLEGVRAFLAHRTALLVLDNFEHLTAAAPAAAELLAACRALTILVTSRAPLALYGERLFSVPPLDLPARDAPADEIERSAAVQLFIDRARAIRPEFSLTAQSVPAVAEICHRLDGLPLAIELAAAQGRHLAPAQLLARMKARLPLLVGGPVDQPARLQTMRGAIAGSYGLLTPEEQGVFRRLAVFVGGFTLEAVDAVGRGSTLDLIVSLIDNSLVRCVDGDRASRFAMLETIREFALEQLVAHDEEAAARATHAAYFVALGRKTASEWYGSGFAECLALWTPELPNLRAALSWLTRTGQVDTALELAAASVFFWYYHGPVGEGLDWLGRLLPVSDQTPTATRAKALEWAANLAGKQGAIDRAAAFAAQAVPVARASGDTRLLGFVLCTLGQFLLQQGKKSETPPLFEEALAIFRAVGPEEFAAVPLTNLGLLAADEGDEARARALCAEALDLRLRAANPAGAAIVRQALADLALAGGDRDGAAALYRENLAVYRALQDPTGLADALSGVLLAATSADLGRIVRLLAAAQAARETTGAAIHAGLRSTHEALLATARDELGEAAFAANWETGRGLTLDQAIDDAEALVTVGSIAATAAHLIASTDCAPPSAIQGLTPRERQVLRLIAEGITDKEIAAALGLSRRTITSHVTSILAKLDVASRSAAAAYAVRHGLA